MVYRILLGNIIFFYTLFCVAATQVSLTLPDAISLAVRTNPNVEISRLNYISEKYSLYIQEWNFYPHYSLGATATVSHYRSNRGPMTTGRNLSIQPGVSLLTPIGTQISLTNNNQETVNYNPGLSLQIVQPLLRGFGKPIVEAALNNARDTDTITKLSMEGLLRSTVSDVISAYLDVVAAEKAIEIDTAALQRARQSVKQTQLYIKAGHKAGNELVTVQANVASAQSQLENDKNNLGQVRYALLTAIGLDPNSAIQFAPLDLEQLINRYQLPTLTKTKNAVLANDIQYQIDQITLHGPTSRGLLAAKDNTRWQLDLTANVATGSGAGGGYNAGTNSLFNGANQNQTLMLGLQIPIDDQTAKQALQDAKIALQEAEINLKTEKWNKETGAINGWNSVNSAETALQYAKESEKLQKETYQISYQKYIHGLIDSLELQSAQLQLIQAQQTLLAAEINYIKSLVSLDLLIGHTLATWHVVVRD